MTGAIGGAAPRSVAFVVPRYGTEVLGGAETGARMFAERLARLGWSAEVFTTRALDALTWADEYPGGTMPVNGVTVHRLESEAGRDPGFHPYSAHLLADPSAASDAEAAHWIDLQGPKCPALVEAVAASTADVVVFYPYLYYPTVRGLPSVAARSVLHPAAHDEPPLALPVFDPVFARAAGLVFQTESERRLVEGRFPVAQKPQIVLGLGVERRPGDAERARSELGIGDRPYLCCIGRVDDKKGTGLLWRYFLHYKERHPGPLALVLAGQAIDRPPEHPDLVVPGPVDDDLKWGLLRDSLALVSPSPWEAFALTVIEGWSAGAPVVVNGSCRPTVEHCARSGGGLWFSDVAHFEAILDRLLADGALRTRLAAAGRRYVDANFDWPVVIRRYATFLRTVATGEGPPTSTGDR